MVLGGAFSYIIGGLPALIAAIWLGRRTYLDGGFTYRQAVTTALVASAILHASDIPNLSLNLLPKYALVASMGVFSAIICRYAVRKVGWFDGSVA